MSTKAEIELELEAKSADLEQCQADLQAARDEAQAAREGAAGVEQGKADLEGARAEAERLNTIIGEKHRRIEELEAELSELRPAGGVPLADGAPLPFDAGDRPLPRPDAPVPDEVLNAVRYAIADDLGIDSRTGALVAIKAYLSAVWRQPVPVAPAAEEV